MITRHFVVLSVHALIPPTIYNILVQPLLGYALYAWSLNLVVDANCLEILQRLVMRLVKSFHCLLFGKTYDDLVSNP